MAGKDDPEQWNRLHQEQIRALHNTEASINQWNNFKSDFEALKNRLHTLPDKVTHDVMVPFGKMAFMPGQLVHTNEILVLLGDNWFAERSAKQAAEIVDRRIEMANKNLEELEKQKQLLLPRQQFTSELEQMSKECGEMFEIREEYDEEKERQWKVAHRKHVREHRTKLKQEEQKKRTSPPTQNSLTDEQLWARLDELEEIETERREVQKVGTRAEKKLEDFQYPRFLPEYKNSEESEETNQNEETDDAGSEEDESSYSASDELDSDDDLEECEEEEEEDQNEEVINKGKLITFSHTNEQTKGSSCVVENAATSDQVLNISTPADIFKQFYQSVKPKSILKKLSSEPRKKRKQKTRKPVVAFQTESDDDARNKVKMEPFQSVETAFSASVIERTTPKFTIATEKPSPPQKDQTVSQRPVSKFKSMSTSQNSEIQKTVPENPTSDTTNVKPVSRFKAQRQKIQH